MQAQELYLQANYFEAEQLIAGYCRPGTMDAEAAMLMASILRRTGRFPQAMSLLESLALLDCGSYWLEEIEREKKLVKQQKIRSHSDSL
jgi:cytochrome c-type biogenesis protein CcmH/NrfG